MRRLAVGLADLVAAVGAPVVREHFLHVPGAVLLVGGHEVVPGVIGSAAAAVLGIEGEAPASYNSLNDTNYLEQLVEGDATSCWPMPNWTSSIIWDLLHSAHSFALRCHGLYGQPLASMKSVTMDDLRSYRFVKFADGYSLSGWTNIERVCQEHGYTPRTRAVLGRTYMNYCAIPLGVEDVMILQASMPQLRYLSDFSRVTVLPVTDDDAAFRLYAIYKKDNYERVRPALDATPAPARSSSTTANPAPWSTASSRAQRELRSVAKFRMPAASSKSLKRRFGQLSVVSCKPKRRLALYQYSSTH